MTRQRSHGDAIPDSGHGTDRRWSVFVAAALSFGAGALDMLTLTQLGGVFASVMTGNLVLMGLGVAHVDCPVVIHVGTAAAGYAVGVAVGSRLTASTTRSPGGWRRGTTITLLIECIALCVFAATWAHTGAHPSTGVQLGLLAVAASCMGLQSAATRGIAIPVATTYLTGTLTALVAARSVHPRQRTDAVGLVALAAVIAGAACGAGVLGAAPAGMPLLCVLPVGAVVLAVHLTGVSRGSRRCRDSLIIDVEATRGAVHRDILSDDTTEPGGP